MADARPLQSAEAALRRAAAALSSASNLLAQADSGDLEVRQSITRLANECVRLRGSVRSVLAQLGSLRREVGHG